MVFPFILLAAALLGGSPQSSPLPAAQGAVVSDEARSGEQPAAKEKSLTAPVEPAVTRHKVVVGGKSLPYTATVGQLPITNDAGDNEAAIFYIAYTADNPPAGSRRPLLFLFNGGPGSSSVWLHLGAVGPRRVLMLAEGKMPPPPYRLVDNEFTWLDQADLVFIDPVGTGYSRAAKPDLTKKFTTVQGDIESLGRFIRLYLTRSGRWDSPLFLVGESYGTFRAAGLSEYLVEDEEFFHRNRSSESL